MYFSMEKAECEKYLTWAEKIVYKRTDAIVSGKLAKLLFSISEKELFGKIIKANKNTITIKDVKAGTNFIIIYLKI